MTPFANRLTVWTGGVAGLLSFAITATKTFADIYDFHGSWLDFALYLGGGVLECLFNAGTAFCVAGLVALPVFRFLESAMRDSLLYKKNKAAPEKKG